MAGAGCRANTVTGRKNTSDVILTSLTVSGIRGVVTCMPDALRQFEQ
jgi:hypothetical protein